MPDKNLSNRDETLIHVLERLAGQLENINSRIEILEKRQRELNAAVRRAGEKREDDDDGVYEDIMKSLTRYRSDMGNLVSVQDSIDSDMKLLSKRNESVIKSQEIIGQEMNNLTSMLEAHEQSAREQYALTVRHGDIFVDKIESLDRNVKDLHMETEKHLGMEHRETQKRIDDFNKDVLQRLMALDGIVANLEVLRRRTEPPAPKEPWWITRQLRKVFGLVEKE